MREKSGRTEACLANESTRSANQSILEECFGWSGVNGVKGG